MRAVLCEELGSPDDLVVRDIEPAHLHANQVQIRVAACSINFPDILMIAGQYQERPELPFVPGGEVSGTVTAVGREVDDVAVGDEVMAVTYSGGLAELINANRASVHPIPAGMSKVAAAGFTGVYCTSYHALRQRAQLQAGENLVVLGAAGGVGLAAVQIGAAMGACVIAAVSSAEKARVALEGGAHHAINYSSSNLREEIYGLTEDRGADVICDPVGGDLFDTVSRCVAWNGRILVVGFAAGRIPRYPVNLALLKGASVVGVFYGRFEKEQPDDAARNMRELLDLYSAGQLRPYVSQTFPLEQAGEAMNRLRERAATGKVVVTMDANEGLA